MILRARHSAGMADRAVDRGRGLLETGERDCGLER